MNEQDCNIVIMGVSCFDGMASSMRVRNLTEPLIEKKLVTVNNLIYQKDNKEPIGKAGYKNNIQFKVIGFRLANIFSIFPFFYGGISFIKKFRVKGKKNIIYNYNYPDIKNIIFILYARMIGYKIIFDIIEDNSYQDHNGFINKFRIKTSLFLFRFSRHFSDAMLAISNHLNKLVKSTFKDKIPVYLIPITVNLNYFKTPGISTGSTEKLKIFYGGSFGHKDGLEYLVKAFDELGNKTENVELILSGLAHKDDFDRINKHIQKAANRHRILYKGYLST
ncbi:MAG: hypothetical protein WBP16_13030, partial [Ferruginibacter sp.]